MKEHDMTNEYYNQIIELAKECYTNRNNACKFFEDKLNEWKPTGEEFINAPKQYEDFKKLLPIGRYRKSQLVGLLQLVGKYEKVTRNDCYNPIFISTTSQSMLDMYGSKMNVSRILKLSQSVYLIEKIESKYRFNANKFSYPQMYIWNKKVQQWIKKVCREEGIEEELKKNIEEEIDIENTSNTLGNSKVNECVYRVGKALNLPNISDDEVHKRLYLTYPFLKKYEQLADEDNESLPPCERIKAKPNIKRNKENTLIKSIGYRMTSSIVSLKEHENEHQDYNGVWRKEYLKEVFPQGYYEYDVKSSIYRITYWLNDGVWLDNDIDLYADIFGNDNFNTKEDRQVFKQFCMSLYFDNPNQIYAHKRNAMPNSINKYGVGSIKNAIERASRLMYKAIGKSYKSEIFVYESCLYMSVVHKMRKMGVKVVQIYDGFYYDKKTDVERIVKECVKELREDIDRSNTSNTLGNNKNENENPLVDDEFLVELKEQEEERRRDIEIERYTSNTLGNSKPKTLSASEFDAFINEMIGGLLLV